MQIELDKCYGDDFTACDTINISLDGDLSNMTSALTNIGSQQTSGIDWNVSWNYNIFKVSLDSKYIMEFEQDDVDYTGKSDGNMGGYSELKSSLSVQANVSEDLSILYNT